MKLLATFAALLAAVVLFVKRRLWRRTKARPLPLS